MSESRDYLEMTFRSISCFKTDGSVDTFELEKIIDIAERDGVVDDNEVRVLNSIASKLSTGDLDDRIKSRLDAVLSNVK